jgi:hypothetical protein
VSSGPNRGRYWLAWDCGVVTAGPSRSVVPRRDRRTGNRRRRGRATCVPCVRIPSRASRPRPGVPGHGSEETKCRFTALMAVRCQAYGSPNSPVNRCCARCAVPIANRLERGAGRRRHEARFERDPLGHTIHHFVDGAGTSSPDPDVWQAALCRFNAPKAINGEAKS